MTRIAKCLAGAALLGTALVAAAAPTAQADQVDGDVLCIWDEPNQHGGLCVTDASVIVELVRRLLGGLASGASL